MVFALEADGQRADRVARAFLEALAALSSDAPAKAKKVKAPKVEKPARPEKDRQGA